MSTSHHSSRNDTWRSWLPCITLGLIVVLELVGCVVIYFATQG